jgi:hypothetical protein
MFDSLVRSPGRLLLPYNTTLQATHQAQRHGHTGSSFAHARLPFPCVDALLTLTRGYSMVRYDIPDAYKLFTFLHIHVLTSWYRGERRQDAR